MSEVATLNMVNDSESVTMVMEPLSSPLENSPAQATSIPFDKRRRVMFAYTDPDQAPLVFKWALDNILQPGRDHVILVDAFVSDPSNPVLTAKKLWDLTAGEDDGAELEMKEKRRKNLSNFILKNLRCELYKHQISSQKYILSVADPRAKLVEVSEAVNADIVIAGYCTPSLIQR
ncbi:hypothetical protein DSO57_1002475 [Entomophthora muscae]|uniref:Uncharacterized protein n=1 Tax=Entomophthora muscae TaxID=34485 RepID=A0ACC2TWI8_9FUNG|nr:hypothetical protein DSO57_1002475 [Entomophthora muscae]